MKFVAPVTLLFAVLFVPVPSGAAVPLSMSQPAWAVYDGTGTVEERTECAPDCVNYLELNSFEGVGTGFWQVNGYRPPVLNGRWLHARIRSSERFFFYVNVVGSDGRVYYVVSSRPSAFVAKAFNVPYSFTPLVYPTGTGGEWVDLWIDIESDLAVNYPGVTVAKFRYVAIRGTVDVASIEVHDTYPLPLVDDYDGDLVTNGDELSVSNPFRTDSDDEGVPDFFELVDACGGGPRNPAFPSASGDTSDNGLNDRHSGMLRLPCTKAVSPRLTDAWRIYDSKGNPVLIPVTDGTRLWHESSTWWYGGAKNSLPPPAKEELVLERNQIKLLISDIYNNGNFIIYVRVHTSDGQALWLTYSRFGLAALGEGYVITSLENDLGYDFSAPGGQFTIYLDLDALLQSAFPAAHVTSIEGVSVRGRLTWGTVSFPPEVRLPILHVSSGGEATLAAHDASLPLLGNNGTLCQVGVDGCTGYVWEEIATGNAPFSFASTNQATVTAYAPSVTQAEIHKVKLRVRQATPQRPAGIWTEGSMEVVVHPAPSIVAIFPSTVAPGQTITIAGGDFLASGTVTIGGVSAEIVSWSNTSIEATGPLTVGEGPADVVVRAGGDPSEPYSISVDGTAPSGSIDVVPTLTNATLVDVVLSASDPNGPLEMQLGGDVVGENVWRPFASSITVEISAGDGEKAVTARFRDVVGNTSSAVTDAVVLDQTLPSVLGSVNVAPKPAKQGDVVYVYFDTSEPITTDTGVRVDGNPASFYLLSGSTYYWAYTVAGSEAEGTVPVDVKLIDLASNAIDISSATVFDFTAPAFEFIHSDKDPAKAGDVLNITVVATEPLGGIPWVKVAGNDALYVSNLGQVYTYSYAVTGSEPEGDVFIDVTGNDLAGNLGTGQGSVGLDFTAPSFSNLTPTYPMGTTSSEITFSVDASEVMNTPSNAIVQGIGPASFLGTYGGAHTFSFWPAGSEPEGPYNILVEGIDPAGNYGSTVVGFLTIDYRPPVIDPAAVSPSTAKKGDIVTITFTAGEALPNLPTVMVDGLDASLVSQVGNDFTYTYTLTGAENNGTLPVIILARDAAGNVGWAALPLMVDAAPFVAISVPSAGAAGVTVTTNVRVRFNEPMDPASINTSAFTVVGSSAVPGSVGYDGASNTATFTVASGTLSYDTIYTVTITTGATDTGGTPLASNFAFTFKTVAYAKASISGSLNVPASWAMTKVIEATGGYLGTISDGTYQITVDKRADNLVFAWNDLNGDSAYQPGSEPRLFAYNCMGMPPTDLWDTTQGSINNANVVGRLVNGTYVGPATWNPVVYEEVTGNRASMGSGTWVIPIDEANTRRLYVFDDVSGDGAWQPGETRVAGGYNPIDFCWAPFVPTIPFGVREIAGRVTEPTFPFVLDTIASSTRIEGPYDYGSIDPTPERAYKIYADVGEGSANVWAFGDANFNGLLDPGETRIPVSANPVTVSNGDVTKAYIFRRKVTGTVNAAPPGWSNPRIGNPPDGNAVAVPLAGSGNPYSIWVPLRPNLQLVWFDDANNNYRFDTGEPGVRYPVLLSTLYADLAGVNFSGTCSIQGSYTPPAHWDSSQVYARAEAVTYSTLLTAPVSAGTYAVGAQPLANQVRLMAYEDTNRSGRFEGNQDRYLTYELNDLDTAAACWQPGRNFSLVRTVSGTAEAPPTWKSPVVEVTSDQPGDEARDVVGAGAGSYSIRTAASIGVYATMFDDANGNLVRDFDEQMWSYPVSRDTTWADQSMSFFLRTITGMAIAPMDAVNPKLVAGGAWASPDASGYYSLYVNDAYHWVVFFDDLNGNNTYDWGLEPIYGIRDADTGFGDTTANFGLFSIEGRVNPPPTWTSVYVDIDNLQTFAVGADGKYVAYVLEGQHEVRMFEDTNGNRIRDWLEPSVIYPRNPVDVMGANVVGVNLDYPTVSGTVQVPPTFSKPMVTAFLLDNPWGTAKPVAPQMGSFSLPTDYDVYQFGLFDDRNGDDIWEFDEPVIQRPVPVFVGDDLSGIAIEYRTIRGAVSFPPTWSRPGVFAFTGLDVALEGSVFAGTYEVYVGAVTQAVVGMYDDRQLRGYFVEGDPEIHWPMPIDTRVGDVNNVNLFYRTIAGSVTAGTTAGFVNPLMHAQAMDATVIERYTGETYEVYVSPWSGPWAVGVFDDFDLNGKKAGFEPGFIHHQGLGCPGAWIDVSMGDVAGVTIDDGCPY